MVSFKEMLGKTSIADVPIEHQHNMQELLKKVNVLRQLWDAPFIVTSGYRTWQDHCRIYGRDNPPKGSQHLIGAAIDIADPKGDILKWLKSNPSIAEESGLHFEDGTNGWVHMQLNPPKSKKRFFYP